MRYCRIEVQVEMFRGANALNELNTFLSDPFHVVREVTGACKVAINVLSEDPVSIIKATGFDGGLSLCICWEAVLTYALQMPLSNNSSFVANCLQSGCDIL